MEARTGGVLIAAVTAAILAPRSAGAMPLAGASALTVRSMHACAALGDGTADCWGQNPGLGNGTGWFTRTPVKVCADAACSASLGSVRGIAAGGIGSSSHTCAMVDPGPPGGGHAIKCWGDNIDGQLGDGRVCGPICETPVDVVMPGAGASAVAAGLEHTCAVTTAGTVRCWGLNDSGQVGDGTQVNRAVPTEVCGVDATPPCTASRGNTLTGATAVAPGVFHTCALTAAGGVVCWGQSFGLTPSPIPGLTSGIASLSSGEGSTCVVTTAEAVKCFSVSSHVPVEVCATGATPPCTSANGNALTGVVSVAVGIFHSCAVTAAGGVKCWGSNSLHGQLGDGQACGMTCPIPVDVCADATCTGHLGGVTAVGVGDFHTCALLATGGVRCWGQNNGGTLGNDGPNSSTPVEVFDEAPLCGDGFLESGEQCDDGNEAGGDGCDPQCRVERCFTCPVAGSSCTHVVTACCGDGHLDAGEQCDDGNGVEGDCCSSSCTLEVGNPCVDPYMCDHATLGAGGVRFDPLNLPTRSLADRFGTDTCQFTKENLVCAAVEEHGGPLHPDTHQVSYLLRCGGSFTPIGGLQVVDEFNPGGVAIRVLKRVGVLAPSGMLMLGDDAVPPAPVPPAPPPLSVDHFLCYKVQGPSYRHAPVPVTVQDRFYPAGYPGLALLKMTKLCTPVNKANEDPTAALHTRQLTCYQARLGSGVRFDVTTVSTNNANFGPQVLRAKRAGELCVPALIMP